jgi:hypothetical protein
VTTKHDHKDLPQISGTKRSLLNKWVDESLLCIQQKLKMEAISSPSSERLLNLKDKTKEDLLPPTPKVPSITNRTDTFHLLAHNSWLLRNGLQG